MADSQTQAAPARKSLQINMVKVLDLGCGLLHGLFVRQSANKSKAAFKSLKKGERIDLGALKIGAPESDQEGGQEGDQATPAAQKPLFEMPLSLELDYSEFRGPGFSHPLFLDALNAALYQIAVAMRAKQDLSILTNDVGMMLVHRPGVVQCGGQYNVLALAFGPSQNDESAMVMKLMFLDPDQYEQLRAEA